MAQEDSGKLLWFIAGGAIGATIALLYAPTSGRETRRLIHRKTREGREALMDGGRDLVDKGRDLYEKGRRVAEDAADMLERGRRLMDG